MVPSSSVEPAYDARQRAHLLEVARGSIAHGLTHGVALQVQGPQADPALQRLAACFVTLRKDGALRGCVGTLQARLPLLQQVARSAYAAAFRDPRFPPLQAEELPVIALHLSVLSEPEALQVASEAELLRLLRPGIDGLVLTDRGRSATFLPAVWDSFPAPRDFLEQLRRKAGLPAGHWSDSLEVERYTAESIS